MQIDNEFVVAAPTERLWHHLLDVERIAPCMPGAELTETVDDHTWKGKLNMKFGPVAMSFAGTVEMADRDDAAHRVSLRAKGMEQKGKGAANATVTSWLEPGPSAEETMVKMSADITLSGAAAQLSRGLLPEISKKLTQQFADCLQERMTVESEPAPAAAPSAEATERVGVAETVGSSETAASAETAASGETAEPASGPPAVASKPVGGIGLGLSAVWSVIKNFFRRLFGGGKSSA
jgi:uncharacterized protein